MNRALNRDLPLGSEMYGLIEELFPICRSLTGNGVRETLRIIRGHLPELTVHEVPTGTTAFDWTVPDEWNIRGARLIGPDGETVVDFANNNLHVVGYSEPVDVEMSLEDLQAHLHSLPESPDAVPYVTSYYRRSWGFCLTHRLRERLVPGRYRAVIDSTLGPGSLTYGELIIRGESEDEVLLSTYICHPSMANDQLSGPAVQTWLAKWLGQEQRRLTYRIVFVPETIGSIVYLSRHIAEMKKKTIAGFNICCTGDDRAFSHLPSRRGNTLADRVATHVLGIVAPEYRSYSYARDRGSDERQYCAPGVDLPVCSLMRSKYLEYPEYHTSLDDLTVVTPAGLAGAHEALRLCLCCLESYEVLEVTVLCEPQLGKRGLYPSLSTRGTFESVMNLINLLAYSDGTKDSLAVAEEIGVPLWELRAMTDKLKRAGLLADLVDHS